MEIYTLGEQGLQAGASALCCSWQLSCQSNMACVMQGIMDVPIYGRIVVLQLFRPSVSAQAVLAPSRCAT